MMGKKELRLVIQNSWSDNFVIFFDLAIFQGYLDGLFFKTAVARNLNEFFPGIIYQSITRLLSHLSSLENRCLFLK